MTENIIDRSETEPATVDNSLNIHRTALNKTTLVSEIPNIINEEMFITLGQGKKTVLILSEKFCEEQAFPYHLLKVNLAIMFLETFQ